MHAQRVSERRALVLIRVDLKPLPTPVSSGYSATCPTSTSRAPGLRLDPRHRHRNAQQPASAIQHRRDQQVAQMAREETGALRANALGLVAKIKQLAHQGRTSAFATLQ
ncbi:hypothetical protein ACS8Y6_16445 [Salinisphaera sp. RV14]|uniref:hypothetical protein n=1 Tax=Salinisphaera sp. RV14 TaxID=3454140 RepID=UPI003F83A5F4